MTIRKVFPLNIGRSMMKSIEISFHGRSGINKGFNSPRRFSRQIDFRLQVLQLRVNFRTSWDNPGHVNRRLIMLFKRSLPG
jgi:hypothetical protein